MEVKPLKSQAIFHRHWSKDSRAIIKSEGGNMTTEPKVKLLGVSLDETRTSVITWQNCAGKLVLGWRFSSAWPVFLIYPAEWLLFRFFVRSNYCAFIWHFCENTNIKNGLRRPRKIRGPKIRANVPPKGRCWRHRVCHLGAIVVAWAARWRVSLAGYKRRKSALAAGPIEESPVAGPLICVPRL